jgi:hypothetical protein
MRWREMAKELRPHMSREVAFACDVLEREGLRFAIDFGTMNAIYIATNRWLEKLDKEK